MWDEGIERNWSLESETVIVGMREWRERIPGQPWPRLKRRWTGFWARREPSCSRMWRWPARRGISAVAGRMIASGAPGAGVG